MSNYGYGDLSGMFGDRYSTQAALNDAMLNEAASLGQLSSYGMGQASTYFQAAGGGTPLGSMLTQAHPTMQRQNILAELQKKHSNPDTPEKLIALAADLSANGFGDMAMKVREAANDLRNSKTAPDDTDSLSTKEKTMRMAEQFHPCAVDAGGWKNADADCKKAVLATYNELTRESAELAGQKSFSAEEGSAFSKDLSTSTEMNREASYYMSTINQSLGFLNEGLYTGTGAETINTLKKVGIAFGMVDPGATATAEQFRVNSMKAIMAWVQKTKGAISEAEMKLFADASEGLSRTVAGNKLILLTAKSLAEYQQRLHAERVRWLEATDNPTRIKWEAHVIGWNVENGNMLPTADEIAEALEQVPSKQAIIESDEIVIEAVN